MKGHETSPRPGRAHVRRRRFGILALATLAAAGAALGISFTADTAVNTASPTALSTASLVYTPTDTLPTGFTFRVATVTDPGNLGDHTVAVAPTLTPVAGTAGTVTAKGDLAVVDARAASTGNQGHERITIYLTNLKQLQAAYTQFAFPIRVYQGMFDHETLPSPLDSTEWDAGSGFLLPASANTYVTNTVPNVSFTVPTLGNAVMGNVLAIQLGEDGTSSPGTTTGDGGSFYTVCTKTSTTCAGGSLSPQFYIAVDTLP